MLKETKETRMIEALLKEHFLHFPPDYPPKAYRADSTTIHVRIVDSSFQHVAWVDRYDAVLPVIRLLPVKTQRDILLLVLFAPDEVQGSGLNYEFEHPSSQPRFDDLLRNGRQHAGKKSGRNSRRART